MSKEITLHFFCGKMAAGKSTLAKEIAEKNNAILVSEDHWLSKLYPEEITNIPEYLKYSQRLKSILEGHIHELLSHEISVVLDFPGNTKGQRNWFRSIYEKENIAHVLHFVDVGDDICKSQLKMRNQNKPKGAAFTTDEEFEEITKYFQVPLESEEFNIIRYKRNSLVNSAS